MHPVQYALIAVTVAFFVYRYLPKVKNFLSAFKSDFQEKKDSNLTTTQQWAIAGGAILSERNNHYCNVLETGADKTTLKDGLREWWGISNSKDAVENLMWLQNEGHRKNFKVVRDILKNYTQKDWESTTKKLDNTGALYQSVTNLFEGLVELKKESIVSVEDFERIDIASWDFARLINNCRWCYDVGYLTEAEAWSFIMPAAERLQRSYTSWNDLAKGYAMGRAMWNGTNSDFFLINDTIKNLLENEKSPWKRISWNTQLN
jgi:hypothetical protein